MSAITSNDTIYKIISDDDNYSIIESKNVLNVTYNNNGTANTIEETLIGTINNINTIFTTSQNFKTGTTKIHVNGLKETNYTEISNNQISLSFAPSNVGFNDKLIIEYEVL